MHYLEVYYLGIWLIKIRLGEVLIILHSVFFSDLNLKELMVVGQCLTQYFVISDLVIIFLKVVDCLETHLVEFQLAELGNDKSVLLFTLLIEYSKL